MRLIERPAPRSDPGEVLVRVVMCGTCASSLKIDNMHFQLAVRCHCAVWMP